MIDLFFIYKTITNAIIHLKLAITEDDCHSIGHFLPFC